MLKKLFEFKDKDMSVLILVEHDNQKMHASTRNVLTAALQLHDQVTMLITGYQCKQVAEEVASLKGVTHVLLADHLDYQAQLPEVCCQLVNHIATAFSHVLCASSTFGKNLLPRCAAKLDVGQLSDVTLIVDKNTYEHPIYAGNAIETVRIQDSIQLITIRTTAFDAVNETQTACPIELTECTIKPVRSHFIEHKQHVSERPDLKNARIVVSGGRGLQSAEQFKLVESLADVLGAAVGASRAAVDANFVANDYQVGQTGKIVAPQLYIAIGISGAVQHMAGMKDSKIIVAINKDPDAPIFQIASYGLVGDLFTVIPELIEILKTRGIEKC